MQCCSPDIPNPECSQRYLELRSLNALSTPSDSPSFSNPRHSHQLTMAPTNASVEEKIIEDPQVAGGKFDDYNVQILDVADEQTKHQVHVGLDQELTPEEQEQERRLVRKIDWHIMPLLLITYGFQVSKPIHHYSTCTDSR